MHLETGGLSEDTLKILAYATRCQLKLLDALESGLSIQDARKLARESLEEINQALDK